MLPSVINVDVATIVLRFLGWKYIAEVDDSNVVLVDFVSKRQDEWVQHGIIWWQSRTKIKQLVIVFLAEKQRPYEVTPASFFLCNARALLSLPILQACPGGT